MAPDRIQTYQRQLADDEARLRRELAKAPAPASGSAPPAPNRVGETSQSDPIADEQRRRDYQSLFADNIALSRRPAEAPSYGERATAARPPTSAMAPAAMSPQELVLLQALVSQRAAVSPPSTPASAPASDSLTANAQAARVETSMAPKETGPIRSTDPLQRLTEGTVIETVLINRLNGSFAGPVECLVTTPVYSHDRQRVVIPAGARALGAAAPVQSWGDSRLAVSFHRLLMPDGRGYSLDKFKGLDQIGETGLKDEVNRHYLQVFGASSTATSTCCPPSRSARAIASRSISRTISTCRRSRRTVLEASNDNTQSPRRRDQSCTRRGSGRRAAQGPTRGL
jgi:type IV secretion system protein VirB10